MNIQLSYQWLQEYAKTDLAPEEFARRLSLSGPAVERIHRPADHLNHVVVGRIAEIRPHPNANRLAVTIVDVGKELLEIVCGGTNLSIGQKVAVAKVGSVVRWHGEGEPIVLGEAEIRGVKSFGMIAASDEISLADFFPAKGEKEILDLSFLEKVPAGTPLAEALGLADVVFDVEVTTNRPDAMSAIGMAREAAAICGAKFQQKRVAERSKMPSLPSKDKLGLTVEVKEKTLCPRYEAVVVDGVHVGPSPWWLRRRLAQAGIRSVNNIVDITNYVMLELGQPMHAFDYHALQERTIVVRAAKPKETITTLDGNTYTFAGGELVIADKARPVAIAGVMGGQATGVSSTMTAVVFEAATFDAVSVRRTARALNVHSDASLRFEKGLSTEGTAAALARAVQLAREIAGGSPASGVKDVRAAAYAPKTYKFRPAKAAELIGAPVPAAKQFSMLSALGCAMKGRGAVVDVTIPWWRDSDIEGERDLVEEVARIWGYHNLPSLLPAGVPPIRPEDPLLAFEDSVRDVLAGAGWTEAISNSMVADDAHEKAGIEGDAVRLANPLTADLAVLRTHLLPSLLHIVAQNQEAVPSSAVFEIGNVYLPERGGLPRETSRVIVASWGASPDGEQFLRVKGAVTRLAEALAAGWSWGVPGSCSMLPAKSAHSGRRIDLKIGEAAAGTLAEVHPATLARFGIETRVAVAVLDPRTFVTHPARPAYLPPPHFPGVKRDLAFFAAERATHAALLAAIRGAHPLVAEVELFDVFRGKGVPDDKKSMAYHIVYRAADRTLTAAEAEEAHAAVVAALTHNKVFAASIRE
ncbi:phenylalanine--tRNA ligase subunit beta [Patescibacteria group bacterium]|nr:MAG: phenylalanine--tRNA ligase subunit beta [Patescibacteria group bacterium]